jgi:hypothetical protein
VDTAPEIEAAPLEMAGRIAGDDESFAKILPSKNALAKNPAAAGMREVREDKRKQ